MFTARIQSDQRQVYRALRTPDNSALAAQIIGSLSLAVKYSVLLFTDTQSETRANNEGE